MALSADYIYTFARKLIRKNQAGSLSASDFEYHWNDAQDTFFDDLIGRFQPRAVNKTGPNTGLIQDKTILQKLSPFTKPEDLIITNGNADKPTGFVYELALRINGFDVIHINHDQKASVNKSVIDPPSVTDNKYYVVEYENYYSFLPITVTSATLDYIITPPDVKWGFIIDPSSGRQIYNQGTSVSPGWDDNSCREITKRMLTNLGVMFKDPDFANFGNKVQVTGE